MTRPRRPARTRSTDWAGFEPLPFSDADERRLADGGRSTQRWRALLDEGGPIIADGAMGTMLFSAGLQFGDPPEAWNLSHPDVVRRIHRAYLDAGSRVLMTNTFGANRLRLSLHGLDRRVAELNRTAAILLCGEVDAAGGQALVAGDIGPSGSIMAPTGTLDYAEAVAVFAEQAAALEAGGVDLVWIETMSDLLEMRAAIEGVRSAAPALPVITTMTFDTRGHTMMGVSPEQAAALVAGGVDLIWIETMSHLSEIEAAIAGVRRVAPGVPIVATMTFDTRGHTMMGVSPEQAVAALAAAGADAIGGNCGNGPNELLPVIERMRAAAPEVTLVAKSNAGMPELVDLRAVYRADPATMAGAARDFRAAGARIIGACCGSTPEHLRAMAEALTGEATPA